MRKIVSGVKATVIGGVFVLLPLAGCALLAASVVRTVLYVVEPVAGLLPGERLYGVAAADLLVAAALLGACLLLGLLVRTVVGRALGRWLEAALLNRIPAYAPLRRLAGQLAGDRETLGAPILLQVEGGRMLAFLVEEHASGEATVFVPAAPAVTVGTVRIVPADRVERLEAPLAEVANCIGQWGVGSAALLRRSRRAGV
jgi:uncharacterized membrane protein